MNRQSASPRRLNTGHSAGPATANCPVRPRWALAMGALSVALLIALLYFVPKPKPAFHASASLEPGPFRDAQFLDLPPEATAAQIELQNVPRQAIQATLRQVESGQVVWRGPLSLTVAMIPADVLLDGHYILHVAGNSGAEVVTYSFRVRRPAP